MKVKAPFFMTESCRA